MIYLLTIVLLLGLVPVLELLWIEATDRSEVVVREEMRWASERKPESQPERKPELQPELQITATRQAANSF